MRKYSKKRAMVHNRKTRYNAKTSVVVVGKIFAHWCGHCQTLLPEWKKLVHVIKTKSKIDRKSHTKYVFAEIEQSHQDAGIARINNTYLAPGHKPLALQGGYPTLFKITDGTLEYYNGPRTYLEMLRWYMSPAGGNPNPVARYEDASVPVPVPALTGGVRKSQSRKIRSKHTRKTRGLFSFLFS